MEIKSERNSLHENSKPSFILFIFSSNLSNLTPLSFVFCKEDRKQVCKRDATGRIQARIFQMRSIQHQVMQVPIQMTHPVFIFHIEIIINFFLQIRGYGKLKALTVLQGYGEACPHDPIQAKSTLISV